MVTVFPASPPGAHGARRGARAGPGREPLRMWWRSGRDSNSRTGYARYGISSAAPSTRLGDRSAASRFYPPSGRLFAPAADLAWTDDVGWLAAHPDVEQNTRPHPVRAPDLGPLENSRTVRSLGEPVQNLDRPRGQLVARDGVDQT